MYKAELQIDTDRMPLTNILCNNLYVKCYLNDSHGVQMLHRDIP